MTSHISTDTLHTLIKRRSQLVDRLKKIKADLGRGLDRDSEEQAAQLENYDVLLEIERVASEDLAKVEQKILEKQRNVDA